MILSFVLAKFEYKIPMSSKVEVEISDIIISFVLIKIK